VTFHGQRVSFRKSSRRKWHQLTTHRLLVRPSDHMGRKFQEAGTNRCQLLEKLDRFLFSRYFHPFFCKAQSPRFWWLLRERWYCLVSDHSEWSCPWVCRGSQVRIESVLCIILLIFLKLYAVFSCRLKVQVHDSIKAKTQYTYFLHQTPECFTIWQYWDVSIWFGFTFLAWHDGKTPRNVLSSCLDRISFFLWPRLFAFRSRNICKPLRNHPNQGAKEFEIYCKW
jgi:hypothetical protein